MRQVNIPPTTNIYAWMDWLSSVDPALGSVTGWRIVLSYGIDPNFALAVAYHEHSLRWTGVAGKTLSFGNAKVGSSWTGRCYWSRTGKIYDTVQQAIADGAPRYELWRAYPDRLSGLQDWCEIIANQYFAQNLTSVEEIIPVYAPASENDTVRYVSGVIAWMDLNTSQRGRGTMRIIPASFKCTVTKTVNVRLGPSTAYRILNQLSPGTEFMATGYTTDGVPWSGCDVWIQTESGWITGHKDYVQYQLPPSVDQLQAQLSQVMADRDMWRQQYTNLVQKAKNTKCLRVQNPVTIAQLLGVDR